MIPESTHLTKTIKCEEIGWLVVCLWERNVFCAQKYWFHIYWTQATKFHLFSFCIVLLCVFTFRVVMSV